MEADNVLRSGSFADALLARTSDVVAVVDATGVLTYVNRAARSLLGFAESDLIGMPAFELVHPDDQLSAFEGFESTISSSDSRPHPLLLRLRCVDGTWRETELIATNHLEDPDVEGLLLAIRDVSQSMRTDRALRASEERYRLIVELAKEGIWVIDSNATTTYANRAMASMLGTTVPQLAGRSIFEFLEDPARHDATAFIRSIQADADSEHDLALRTSDGRRVWTRINWSPARLHDGTSNGLIALVTDVTERRRLESLLEHEARFDALTGVANRTTLFEKLTQELSRGAHCAVLFADLDNFKQVNDAYGHRAGDETLRVVARRISCTIRECDTLARVGGDEFVVVSSPIRNEEEALTIGSRIREAVRAPIRLGGTSIPVGLSLGIAIAAGDDDADSVLSRADHALYRAKRSGGGRLEVASCS